jgi:uncharacterized membrane protein YebE (DUF533 family)
MKHRPHALALALAASALFALGGCTAVAVTGAVVGTAVGVTSTVVGTAVGVGSAAGSAVVNAVSSDDPQPRKPQAAPAPPAPAPPADRPVY